MEKNTVNFKKGKIPRSELELPTLHFVVMDQWVEVIGEKALISWLRMYTWCKRDEENTGYNLWEQAKIPTSMNKIIKKLGVGRDTFYNKILKPLWNVALIDIEEYEHSENLGLKPMNIIVYKYPQNNKSLAHQQIEIIRNYDTDYTSEAKAFTHKGGRPKNNSTEQINENNNKRGSSETELGSSEIELGSSQTELGLFSNRTRDVPNENMGMFQERTRGSSQIGHNNIFNSINNPFNSFSNIFNNLNNYLNNINNKSNQSIYENLITTLEFAKPIKIVLQKKIDRLMFDQIDLNEILITWEKENNSPAGLNEYQFADMLNTALTHAKDKIGSKGSVSNFIKAAIKKYKDDMVNGVHSKKVPIRTELIPANFDKNNDSSPVDLEELEAKRVKLNETLKQLKANSQIHTN